MENKLWYISSEYNFSASNTLMQYTNDDTIFALNDISLHDPWHYWLGDPREKAIRTLHQHVHGVPSIFLPVPLFNHYCCDINLTKKIQNYNPSLTCAKAPYEQFNMDFGLVRASPTKGEDKIIASGEGYSSYLLIVNDFLRYL